MSDAPKFSIVIPTRNRAATLKASLRTCIDIDHPNFEIVVSDNDSSDDTADVVAALADRRIRYVKTAAYLSMSRNFENGLKHAKGEFVIFIGDDDGVMPFALRVLECCFERQPDLDLIDWCLNPFFWPHARSASLTLNWLSNLGKSAVESSEEGWERINRPRSIDYNDMNGFNLYHGCVRRSVLDAAAQTGASVFACPVPDIGGGMRVLRFARRKLTLDVAMTVNGTSQKSTGWAHVTPKPTSGQLDIRADFKTKTFSEYPDSATSKFFPSRAGSFLGSLMDEHIVRYGNLKGIDLRPWRPVYLEQLVNVGKEELGAWLADTNAIFALCRQGGAAGIDPLSEDDVEAHRAPSARLPRRFNLPFLFSDDTIAAARRAPAAPARIAEPRIVSMTQRPHGIVVGVQAEGEEFTIHDYVQLMLAVMRCEPFDTVKLLTDDPAVFRSKVVLNVLGHLAAAG
jgi:hypothetical protein